ncbi:MAG: hypothetical protein A2133_09165 [Actinobacteria bacterium RBG_16_64_13]|nr:MAG: hypothetical protein A2133_09165 [Actinobacteria bacterium RBG_16_64_13]
MLTEIHHLREFKIFEELNERELEVIASIANTDEVETGTILTRVGTSPSTLYLIMKGLVSIMTSGPEGEQVTVDQVGPGHIVGWSALTGTQMYTASTVTAEPSTLIVINGRKLRQIFEVNNHIGYRVLKGIGYTLARRMAAIETKIAVNSGGKG